MQRLHNRWRQYPLAGPALIDRLPNFPDLILIDGRFRVASCLAMVKAAIERRVSTQILFDDYALRSHYQSIEAILGRPEMIGRAALFRIGETKISLPDLDAALTSALRDYR